MLRQVSAHFYYKQYTELKLDSLQGLQQALDNVPLGRIQLFPLPGMSEISCVVPLGSRGQLHTRRPERIIRRPLPAGMTLSCEPGSESLYPGAPGPRRGRRVSGTIPGEARRESASPGGSGPAAARLRVRRATRAPPPAALRLPSPGLPPPASAPRPLAATRARRSVRKMEAKARGAPAPRKPSCPSKWGTRGPAARPVSQTREPAGHRGRAAREGTCLGRRLQTRGSPTPAPGTTYRASAAPGAPSRPAAAPAAPAAPYGSPAAGVQVQTAAPAREPKRLGRDPVPDTPFASLPPPGGGSRGRSTANPSPRPRESANGGSLLREEPTPCDGLAYGRPDLLGALGLRPSLAFRARRSRSLVRCPWGRARARRLAARRVDGCRRGRSFPACRPRPQSAFGYSFILHGAHCCTPGAPLTGFRRAGNARVGHCCRALPEWGQSKRRLETLPCPGVTNF